ncbi:MAG TPA: DnaJ domain-containing protein, partial [Opitutales bacterium]|nr:DnaJ domain-containing protein [Opitutales bacterium]
MQFKDYYKTLAVSREASPEDLKKAFRKLAREYHPDSAGNKPGAEEKFKEINEAYEVLGDLEKRKRYDQLGSEWDQQGAQTGSSAAYEEAFRRARSGARGPGQDFGQEFRFGGTGFSDFFEFFFGGQPQDPLGGMGTEDFSSSRPRSRMRGRSRSPMPEPGRDLEAQLLVNLEENLRGGSRHISLRRTDPVTGETKSQTLKIKIPIGVQDLQRIRAAGQGGAGTAGGPAGDLYLNVRFERHPDLRVEGQHLVCDLEVYPWELALGA